MRKSAIILGTLVIVCIYILNDQNTERLVNLPHKPDALTDNVNVESDFVEVIDEHNPTPEVVELVVEAPAVRVADERKLAVYEEELELLIHEYDQHLGDREKRAEIEQQMVLVVENYKQEVLAKVKSLQ